MSKKQGSTRELERERVATVPPSKSLAGGSQTADLNVIPNVVSPAQTSFMFQEHKRIRPNKFVTPIEMMCIDKSLKVLYTPHLQKLYISSKEHLWYACSKEQKRSTNNVFFLLCGSGK